jgi:abortive infection bacteriophage resistance protein
VKYEKPAKTCEEQADLLLSRGLVADRTELISVLEQINYYRLSTYLYTFRDGTDNFLPGTSLKQILRLYEFDHELRILLIDIIEGIEILVRSRLAYFFALKHGPFAWKDPALFPNFNPAYNDFDHWQDKLAEQTRRSRDQKSNEDTVVHFFRKYGDLHDCLPVWILVEIMDFGATLSFYRGVEADIRKNVARSLNQPEEVVLSWLLSLNTVRNRCAHHARLWNWNLGISVKLPNPRKYPEWNVPGLSNRELASVLYLCAWISKNLVSKDYWLERARSLFRKYEDITLKHIGMPDGWEKDEIWIG